MTDLPGVDHLGQLTPFQNQVIDAAEAKIAEEKEKQQKQMKGGSGPPTNPRSSAPTSSPQQNSSGLSRTEKVRYINKEVNPDHPVHDDD